MADDPEEFTLERGVGEDEATTIEELAQRRHPGKTGAGVERAPQSFRVSEIELIRRVDRSLQVVLVKQRGEVKQRPHRRGDRNAIEKDAVLGRQRPSMHPQSDRVPSLGRHGHVDLSRIASPPAAMLAPVRSDAPEDGCGLMAQDGRWPCEQRSRHEETLLGELRPAHGVYAAPGPAPVLDRMQPFLSRCSIARLERLQSSN
jgi:hypothetical protein